MTMVSGPKKVPLEIVQGDTWEPVFRWYNKDLKVYKSITAVPQTAPVHLTVTGHGVPDGWTVLVDNVLGMKELNDVGETPATLVDANTIELNAVNAAGFKAYTSGGTIEYFSPWDLTDYTARMDVRANIPATTELLDLDSGSGEITINNTTKTIKPFLSAVATAALTWTSGVYDLELVSSTSAVVKIAYGPIRVVLKEVTR